MPKTDDFQNSIHKTNDSRPKLTADLQSNSYLNKTVDCDEKSNTSSCALVNSSNSNASISKDSINQSAIHKHIEIPLEQEQLDEPKAKVQKLDTDGNSKLLDEKETKGIILTFIIRISFGRCKDTLKGYNSDLKLLFLVVVVGKWEGKMGATLK